MELLITYDVDTTTPQGRRRLRRVAKICEGYGIRVQKSVFEVVCSEADWLLLHHRLLDAIDSEHDSIRSYPLPRGTFSAAHHLGHSPSAGHDEPLIY
ncbi:CRISPR-associated endonuclease Cas2 [Saccharopolyspora rosea]|uniref:CRISPR-associated endoribonuclease Cas2 n=1 Tax=Saccharopolyspora rosea TaxID=524884 RepID=A0ABW3FXW4_9PSEU